MEETEQEQQTTEDKKKLKIPINQSNQFSELWYTVKSELWEVNSEFRFFFSELRDLNSELQEINSEFRFFFPKIAI